MTLPKSTLEPNIYTIPSGSNFAEELAREIWQSFSDAKDPSVLSRVTLLVPTRRAVGAVQEAFERVTPGTSLILPRVRPIGDVDEEALIFEPGFQERALIDEGGSPPPISSLKRQLILARLVEAWAEATGGVSPSEALDLAADLGMFLDKAEREEVDLSRLDRLVPETFAVHWQQTLVFLKVITEAWPEILAEHGVQNPAAHRSKMIRQLAESWRAVPPPGPVLIAGSTGSIPATADLMNAVLGLPQGFVVLPGLDQSLDAGSWEKIGPTHPQFGLKDLLQRLDRSREDVRPWPLAESAIHLKARLDILNQALRPAETTEAWQSADLRELDEKTLSAAFAGFSYVEADDPSEEARVIALAMREVLEDKSQKVALVTPDRSLARRVSNELKRWQINVNDSAGIPLQKSVQGSLFQLLISCVSEDFPPTTLLALLKHPLLNLSRSRPALRAQAAELEILCLRGPRPGPGLSALQGLARSRDDGPAKARSIALLADLECATAPLVETLEQEADNPRSVFLAAIEVAENLAATEDKSGADRLWTAGSGEAFHDFLSEVLAEIEHLKIDDAASYPSVFSQLMAGRVVRPRFGQNPRVFIWGPLEARLQSADLLILGGLNEKTWPQEVGPDPWLSRPMSAALGLSEPERRIGLGAHDFAQLAAAPRVLVTRALKQDGAPTIQSRWMMRLENVCKGFGFETALSGSDHYVSWARALDAPEAYQPWSEPEPRPPFAARPRQISVTEVERWIRDPYGFYARRVLELQPLEALEADAGAAERGTIIHEVLERFVKTHGEILPDDPRHALLEVGREVFEEKQASPEIWLFWWPRFEAIAEWFVAREMRREGARPLGLEVRGQMTLEAPGGLFTLTARADRIDLFEDGSVGIYDYKTGFVPTQNMVSSGLSPQLALEAMMVLSGAFERVGKLSLSDVAYLELRGGDPAGKEKPIKKNLEEIIAKTEAGLRARIALFDDIATHYPSRTRPMLAAQIGPYDHLARVKEWSVYGQEGG